MRCPQCLSQQIKATPYSYEDRETGYKEQGVRYTCQDCGAVSTEEEIDRDAEVPYNKDLDDFYKGDEKMWVKHEVESSNISELAYNQDELKARCTFKDKNGHNTSTWEYAGVSQEVFDEWLEAPSKGRFLNSRIKGAYQGRDVTLETQ